MHSIGKHSFTQLADIEIGRIKAKDLDITQAHDRLELVVIIPCYAEDAVHRVLESIDECERGDIHFEVILLINESEDVAPEMQMINENCFASMQDYLMNNNLDWPLHIVYITDIPAKKAGVGMARKLAMDQAALRFKGQGFLDHGIIVDLDADCTVSTNYLQAIVDHFDKNPKDELVSIAFQHSIDDLEDPEHKEAIRMYEAYLHYFIGMQRELGLPYAYQTIGSAFAVRAGAYLQVGGMNTRKAGEDFYFIHKFTKKGSIAELNECKVYPSGRSSFRVPFGTGKAVADMMESASGYLAYHPQSFYDLREFVNNVDGLYMDTSSDLLFDLPRGLQEYLQSQKFEIEIDKIRSNTSNHISFRKAFFQWFDAFRLMKYLHYVRDHYYPSIPIDDAINLAKS